METEDVQKVRYKRLLDAWHKDYASLAIERARAFLKDYPEHGPAWMILGNSLTAMTHYEEAERALLRAIEFCPPEKIAFPLSQMGHHHDFRGDFARAADWYRKVIAADPDDAGGYIYLGGSLAKDGRLEEAESAHRQATQCKAGCIDEAFFNLGLILRAQRRYEEAARCFERAIELDPHYKDAKLELRDVRRTLRFLRGNN